MAGAPGPVVLTARLYPSNDIAARNGVIGGSVTSPTDSKGVFTISYNGESLPGEATRTTLGGVHTGIANASAGKMAETVGPQRFPGISQTLLNPSNPPLAARRQKA